MTLAEASAKRIKELLFQQKMTQYRLIKESCLDKSTIQALFKGKTKDINLSTIFVIANVFNLTLTEFFDAPYFNKEDIDYI
ncbi:MAG: helix-turn-helix transcriptional regulator [Clostridia bacterium]|nr:helix-turn-helix transcriptional regulator [Clostridia bacterium]